MFFCHVSRERGGGLRIKEVSTSPSTRNPGPANGIGLDAENDLEHFLCERIEPITFPVGGRKGKRVDVCVFELLLYISGSDRIAITCKISHNCPPPNCLLPSRVVSGEYNVIWSL